MFDSAIRLSYDGCRELLRQRLAEPAPGRIQLLLGPRQVGKTTLLLALAEELGPAVIYEALDGPGAALPGFWERLWTRVEAQAARVSAEQGAAAGEGQRRGVVVLLDEAHALADWAEQLKAQWDRLRRLKLPVHLLATGSSALGLSSGSRESLAGRFERLALTHWSASTLASAFGVSQREALATLLTLGAYPGTFELRHDRMRCLAYLRDAIVEPAIGRDILAQGEVRRPALLRQVFAVCASSPAQVVSLSKIQGQLQDRGALETIAHYLQLLQDAYLIAALPKHSARAPRSRAAPPKLVALSNGFLAAVDPSPVALELDARRYGAWVENACLAFAINSGQRVSYWRTGDREVDGVLDGSWGQWAIEVKTGRFGSADLRGLAEFTRRYPKHQPLVLCDPLQLPVAERAGIAAMPWKQFLLEGPAPSPGD